MGDTQKLTPDAEGVETAAEVERLRRLGCDLAQGYFFARPVEADAAEALLGRELELCEPTTKPGRRRRAPRPRRPQAPAAH